MTFFCERSLANQSNAGRQNASEAVFTGDTANGLMGKCRRTLPNQYLVVPDGQFQIAPKTLAEKVRQQRTVHSLHVFCS